MTAVVPFNGRAKRAATQAGSTLSVADTYPKSPPFMALGSVEYWRATSAKASPAVSSTSAASALVMACERCAEVGPGGPELPDGAGAGALPNAGDPPGAGDAGAVADACGAADGLAVFDDPGGADDFDLAVAFSLTVALAVALGEGLAVGEGSGTEDALGGRLAPTPGLVPAATPAAGLSPGATKIASTFRCSGVAPCLASCWSTSARVTVIPSLAANCCWSAASMSSSSEFDRMALTCCWTDCGSSCAVIGSSMPAARADLICCSRRPRR